MAFDTLTIPVPPALARDLATLAQENDVTPGQIVRHLIEKELRRVRSPKTPNRADEPLVARLQRLLAADMASAVSWPDLSARLDRRGFRIMPAGGGLTLHDAIGKRMCKASELGFPYSRLVRKFRAPMPGHPHRMRHVLNDIAAGVSPDGDDDFSLIEDD